MRYFGEQLPTTCTVCMEIEDVESANNDLLKAEALI